MNHTLAEAFSSTQLRLAKDLRTIVRDAEELLRHAVTDAGQGYAQARERLEKSLDAARNELAAAEQAVLDGIGDAGRASGRYVRRHTWESIGVGAGLGLLAGLLIARR